MTCILPFITARVITARNERIFSGRGYVEKADGEGKFVITLSSGKITVQCTSGSLSEGDTVFVKAQGKDLIIERLCSPTPLIRTSFIEDALELHGQSNTISADAPQSGDLKTPSSTRPASMVSGYFFPLDGKDAPSEGFYYFDTIEKALSWLSHVSAAFDKKDQRLMSEEFAHAPVIVQVIETEKEGVRAILLPLQSADSRLSCFVKEHLQSDLWKILFPDGLLPLLQERGALSSERIIAIDTLLPKNDASNVFFMPSENDLGAGIGGAMGKTGANQLFVQWLNIAMDETAPLSILSSIPPFFTSVALPPLVEKIQSMQQTESNALSPLSRVEGFSIEQSIIDNLQAKEVMVPRILERLGINYENTLLNLKESDDAISKIAPNLKFSLLKLEGDLDNAASQKSNEPLKNPLLSLHTACRAFSEIWTLASGRLLRELFPALAEQSYAREDGPIEPGKSPVEGQVKQLYNQFHDWSTKIITLMESIKSEIVEQAVRVQSAEGYAEGYVDTTREGASPLPGGQHNPAIKEAAQILDKLVQSVALHIKTASGEFSENIEGLRQTVAAKFAEGNTPLAGLRTQIHAAMREIVFQGARHVRAISSLVDQIAIQSSRLLDNLDREALISDGKPSFETARRMVETALKQIESMQIAAKPTASGDVRQQVVMIPMKIDGEWNDVIVKFVRDNGQGNKKNPRKNISVAINVAPAFLGEINVSMDYKGPNNCSIRMEFDNDRTLSWFEKNRQGFIDAFVKLGFQGLRIDMQKSVRPKSPKPRRAIQASNAAIDIVI